MLLPLTVALALRVGIVPKAVAYRWQSGLLGTASVTALALPAKGSQVFVAAGGVGYVARSFDHPERIPLERVTGVAAGAYEPDIVVAVGRATDGVDLQFSTDGGQSWRPGPTSPPKEGGSVVLSPDGKTWVWTGPDGGIWSDDYGFTWTPCEDLPGGARVVAGAASFRRFYALAEGRLLVSNDGARSFDERVVALAGLDPDDSPQAVVPTPGRSDDLWLLTKRVLYHSRPGKPFVRVPGVADPRALAFGQSPHSAYPGNLAPALFLGATVEGRTGLFRSDDEGIKWDALAGAPPLGKVASLVGDPNRYGRVYVLLAAGGLSIGNSGR